MIYYISQRIILQMMMNILMLDQNYMIY